jgi:hypothetical protein
MIGSVALQIVCWSYLDCTLGFKSKTVPSPNFQKTILHWVPGNPPIATHLSAAVKIPGHFHLGLAPAPPTAVLAQNVKVIYRPQKKFTEVGIG